MSLDHQPEHEFKNRLGGFEDVNKWRRRVFIKALEKAKSGGKSESMIKGTPMLR